MELNIAQQRQQAHSLLEGLPEEKFLVVRNLLEVLADRDPDSLSQSLANAPVEDEELTPETMAALNRAAASFDRGEGVSHEEMRREFGL
jgi:hypothetical protein